MKEDDVGGDPKKGQQERWLNRCGEAQTVMNSSRDWLRRSAALAFLACVWIPATAAEGWLADPLRSNALVPPRLQGDLLPPGYECTTATNLPSRIDLAHAVAGALCADPATHQSWAAIRAQAAGVGLSRAAYLPTAKYSGNYNDLNRKTELPGVRVIGEGEPRAITQQLNARASESLLSVNWVLYDFGVRKANRAYALQLLNAAVAAHDDAVQNVFLKAVRAFYEMKAARAFSDSATQAAELTGKIFEATEAIHAVGVGSMSDKLQTQTALAQARLEQADAEEQLALATGNLATRMGLPPDTAITLDDESNDSINSTASVTMAVDALLAEAMSQHPQIREAQANLGAAEADASAIRARGRPVVSMVGTYRRSDTPVNVSLQQIFTDRVIGLQIEFPLFEGFSRKYQVRQARAEVESREAELKLIQQRVSQEVWNSYQSVRFEIRRIELASTLQDSARKSFEVSQEQFRAGYGEIMQLLKAQADLAAANKERIVAQTRLNIARFRLSASIAALDASTLY